MVLHFKIDQLDTIATDIQQNGQPKIENQFAGKRLIFNPNNK
ncbi:hypothetical protein [Rubritalea tangerina]